MAKLYLGNREITPSIYTNGSGSDEKFGITIDAILGNVDANGVLQKPTGTHDLVFTRVKDVGAHVLYRTFMGKIIHSASFPDLEQLTNQYSFYQAFTDCSSLVSISFPKLKTISGTYSFANALSGCKLTSVVFPELTSITGANSFRDVFGGCTTLTSVSFPKLAVITGNMACVAMLSSCSSVTDVYFPSLTTTSFGATYTNQFANLLSYSGSRVIHTIHFPSNLESTIQGLESYPLFGGKSGSVVLSFDLPATS